jgi:integrase
LSGVNEQRKEAGFPPLSLYDMRHTAASTLAAKGAHISVVAELMGHASTKMTADLYTHVMPSMRAGLAELPSDAYCLSKAAPQPVS